jgi:hypothetical protein
MKTDLNCFYISVAYVNLVCSVQGNAYSRLGVAARLHQMLMPCISPSTSIKLFYQLNVLITESLLQPFVFLYFYLFRQHGHQSVTNMKID